MQNDDETRNYRDLSWGRGPCTIDVFLEPTCPNSARAFAKLKPLLEHAGADRLTVRIWLHSQPWHIFSSVVVRAILAASGMKDGKEAAHRAMSGIFENREEFICTDHCRGPNLERSPAEILQLILDYTGLDLRPEFERKVVTDLIKRHTRFARQNGIHASPTFMVDGLVNDRISSRDPVENWITELGLADSADSALEPAGHS